MKNTYVSDLLSRSPDSQTEVGLLAWISSKRDQGKVIFFDASDSTGKIQVVASQSNINETNWQVIKKLHIESGVSITGRLCCSGKSGREIIATSIDVIGQVTKIFSPHPRENVDIFDESLIPHMLNKRHMYIRNPQAMAILKFRDALLYSIRQWFHDNGFTSIDAPILTPVPLYEDDTAISLTIRGDKVFLTQCVGYYLEAAVHAFEKVFTIGPSFRGEEGRSKRHLMEYWHIKAEMTWSDLDDIINIVERVISYLSANCQKEMEAAARVLGRKACNHGLITPYPRLSYEEAVKELERRGLPMTFGKSLGSDEEAELSKLFPGQPFWVTGIPCSIEPFPYIVDPDDTRVTRVADLIASNGYGELLGTAEKIHDLSMLDERLKAKGKYGDKRFDFVRDVHQVGCVPHAAFGMGVERMIRWLLDIPHVRDAAAFPRTFERKITP